VFTVIDGIMEFKLLSGGQRIVGR